MNKNKLNVFIILLFSFSFCIILSSCKDKDDEKASLFTDVPDVIFEAGADTKTIEIGNGNLTDCVAIVSGNWCSVSIQGSSAIIKVQANDNYFIRETFVTIKYPVDNTFIVFQVTQKGVFTIIPELSNDEFVIPETGGDYYITVNSNISFRTELLSGSNWVKISKNDYSCDTNTMLSTFHILFTAEKNNTGDSREAIINLFNTSLGITKQIKIIQGFEPFIKTNIDEYNANVNGEMIEIAVSSNMDFEMQSADNWISDAGKVSIGENEYIQKIKIEAMDDNLTNRSAIISFKDKNGKWSVKKDIMIYQKRTLSIDENEFELYIDETYVLKVTNTTGHSLVWSSSAPSRAKVDSEGAVTGLKRGSVTITATTDNGQYSDEIKIKVIDINSKLSSSFSISEITIGSWHQYAVGCTLTNNSKFDINLQKCTVYRNGNEITSTTDQSILGLLQAGQEKSVSVSNISSLNGISFLWEYQFNGKTYTYSCSYNK